MNNWKPIDIGDPKNLKIIKTCTAAYTNLVDKYRDNKIGWEAEFRMAKIYSEKLNNFEKADSIFNKITGEVRSILYIDESYFGLAKIAVKKDELFETQKYLKKVIESRMTKLPLA